jgi:hypothetical protein
MFIDTTSGWSSQVTVVVHALEPAPAGQFAVDEDAEQNLGILAALLEFGPGAGQVRPCGNADGGKTFGENLGGP